MKLTQHKFFIYNLRKIVGVPIIITICKPHYKKIELFRYILFTLLFQIVGLILVLRNCQSSFIRSYLKNYMKIQGNTNENMIQKIMKTFNCELETSLLFSPGTVNIMDFK